MHFFQIPPLVDNEHVGQIQSPRVGARRCLRLCIMFIGDKVVSCSFIVIIMKVEMLYVV